MNAPSDAGAAMSDTTTPAPRRHHRSRQAMMVVAGLLATYLVLAYVVLPLAWRRFVHHHPTFDAIPRITYTGAGIPGDPLNVALVGTEADVKRILQAAKWHSADPLSLRSSLEMVDAAVLKREYDAAPVSNLYFQGRKEDLAFEQAVGDNPRHRHHVRFWRLDNSDTDGRPTWVGAAVYDERVGLSRRTGQVTHVTAADVDTERDYLFHGLEQSGELAEQYAIEDFHTTHEGRNGGGDPWRTDGKLLVGIIAASKGP